MEREALEHAIRCWEAEEENAGRIATRKNLIVGLPTGLLATAGFNADQIARFVSLLRAWDTKHPEQLIPAVLGILSLLLAAGCLLTSVALAVGVQSEDPEHRGLASARLHLLRSGDIVRMRDSTESSGRSLAFARTVSAARSLLRLNQAVEARLHAAVAWLLPGLVFSLVAVLAYAWVVA